MKSKSVFHRSTSDQEISGGLLVADFQMAITNLVTMETAKLAAEQSERMTMQSLENAAAMSSAAYLAPGDIPVPSQEVIVRSSVDAHVKKVQAKQLSSFTTAQVTEMENEDKRKYVGRKVRVSVTDQKTKPVVSVWLDNKTGRYRNGHIRSKTIKGVIEDIVIEKNLLVLRPTVISRTLMPSRKYFFVSIIDVPSLKPMVGLELL